jgi:predicted HicB family RNase H-like nuclease
MKAAMITVRLPAHLHKAVKELAYQKRKSMNQCLIGVLTNAVLSNRKAAEVLREGGS